MTRAENRRSLREENEYLRSRNQELQSENGTLRSEKVALQNQLAIMYDRIQTLEDDLVAAGSGVTVATNIIREQRDEYRRQNQPINDVIDLCEAKVATVENVTKPQIRMLLEFLRYSLSPRDVIPAKAGI